MFDNAPPRSAPPPGGRNPTARQRRPAIRALLARSIALLPVALPLVLPLALLAAAPRPAAAEDAPLRLELNRLEARDNGACRVWLVANNPGDKVLDPLRIDLVLFGRDGLILRRLAVDLGPLQPARTAVRIFDVAGQSCDDIGQLLLNDVLACGADSDVTERVACANRIALSSRAAGVEFHK